MHGCVRAAYRKFTCSTSRTFHVAPCRQGIGNMTEPPPFPSTSLEPPPTAEWSVSAEKEIGMPKRVLLVIQSCSSFWAAKPAACSNNTLRH